MFKLSGRRALTRCGAIVVLVALGIAITFQIGYGTSAATSEHTATSPTSLDMEAEDSPLLLTVYVSDEPSSLSDPSTDDDDAGDITVLQSSTIVLNPQALEAINPHAVSVDHMPMVRMELFSDLVVDVEFVNAKPRWKSDGGEPVEDGFLIRGKILEPHSGYVVLRARSTGVFGSISVDTYDRIELWRAGSPVHRAMMIEDPPGMPGVDVAEMAGQAMGLMGGDTSGFSESSCQMPTTECPSNGTCDDGCTIDVLALYTAAARECWEVGPSSCGMCANSYCCHTQQGCCNGHGQQTCDSSCCDSPSIADVIESQIWATNAIIDQSDIVPEGHNLLRLVHIVETDYDDSGQKAGEVLSGVKSYEPIRLLRNALRADLVATWFDATGTGGPSGVADRPAAFSLTMEERAFTVQRANVAAWIVAHEIGHNFGFRHDRFEDCGCDCQHQCGGGGTCLPCSAIQDYAFGWHFEVPSGPRQGTYRTIMTYPSSCFSAQRIDSFSNPDIEFYGTGVYTGDACANNALVARGANDQNTCVYGTRFLLAQHRTSDDTTDTTTMITTTTDEPPGFEPLQFNGPALSPAISGDGRYLLFSSTLDNLPQWFYEFSDPPNESVFRFDRESGNVTRLSEHSPGNPPDGDSFHPAVSGDGRVYAFVSNATNLSSPPLSTQEQHVRVRVAKAPGVAVISRASDTANPTSPPTPGEFGNGDSDRPAVNYEGSQIAYESLADNLVEDDENELSDIFVAKRGTVTWDDCDEEEPPNCEEEVASFLETVRISVSTTGVEADGGSFKPAISETGRFVVFESEATNLGTEDTLGYSNIWVRDRDDNKNGVFDEVNEVTTLQISQSHDHPNDVPDNDSEYPDISGDGRYIVFMSHATNLLDPQEWSITGTKPSIFLFDRDTSTTRLITRHWDIPQEPPYPSAEGRMHPPRISVDGKWIIFGSDSSELDESYSTAAWRTYLYSVEDEAIVRVYDENEVGAGIEPWRGRAISGDGRFLAIEYLDEHVYLHDRGLMLVGDLNGDGVVDEKDLDILQFNWCETTDCCLCCAADLNQNGKVDNDDLEILCAAMDDPPQICDPE